MRLFYPLIPQRDYWHGGHFCVPSCYKPYVHFFFFVAMQREKVNRKRKNTHFTASLSRRFNQMVVLKTSFSTVQPRYRAHIRSHTRGSPNLLPLLGLCRRKGKTFSPSRGRHRGGVVVRGIPQFMRKPAPHLTSPSGEELSELSKI